MTHYFFTHGRRVTYWFSSVEDRESFLAKNRKTGLNLVEVSEETFDAKVGGEISVMGQIYSFLDNIPFFRHNFSILEGERDEEGIYRFTLVHYDLE